MLLDRGHSAQAGAAGHYELSSDAGTVIVSSVQVLRGRRFPAQLVLDSEHPIALRKSTYSNLCLI